MTGEDGYEYDRAHMFRLRFDGDPDDGLFDWMDVWLTNWGPWETDAHGSNDLPTLHEPEDGGGGQGSGQSQSQEPYYTADWWFSFAEDPEIMYGHLIGAGGQITELTARTDWARVAYHECTHPGAGGRCEWNEVRDHGDVPDYIADMEPND